jgi:hypothetical protein
VVLKSMVRALLQDTNIFAGFLWILEIYGLL